MAPDPYRNVHSNASQIIWDLARFLYTWTRSWCAHTWVGRGWSPSGEHGSIPGKALDYIISARVGSRPTATQRANGWVLANYLAAHAKQMHLRHIIWDRRIYRTRYGTWGPLPGRNDKSGVSDWHEDHLHLFFDDILGTLPALPGAAAPALPQQPSSTAPHLVGRVSVAALRTARNQDPRQPGTPMGPYDDQVFTMETALAKTKWIAWPLVDGHYGIGTVGDGSPGLGGATGFQRKHSNTTSPDGWLGERELAKLFTLADMKVSVAP